ncbi:hypothetical protein IID24_05995, partial [Patescibacteria group bacterium]|nr:hypothetical protein [Patescibacteria group bacterium]
VYVYENGAYLGEKNMINPPCLSSTSDLLIGSRISGTSEHFNGTIDDIMMFNRSLSLGEIEALYANTTTRHLNVNFTSLSDGLHTFTGYAVDIVGNKNQTEDRRVTIDTSVPDVTINFPAATQTVSGFRPNITVSSDVSSCVWETLPTISIFSAYVGWWCRSHKRIASSFFSLINVKSWLSAMSFTKR